MTRASRMAPVQTLFDDNQRKLAQSLAAFERRVAENEKKLEELSVYRTEYEKQYAARAARGIGAADLRDYQVFLARLTEAIRQQQGLVERARAEREAERARWADSARRVKALEVVVDGWRADERRASDRRDQRESDERAQRKVSAP